MRVGFLVEFRARDRLLEALFIPPASQESIVLLHIHGKGGNFYSGMSRALPRSDGSEWFGHFSINMACHDLGYTRYDRPMPDAASFEVGGAMWEEIASGHLDVIGAVDWLRGQGYDRIVAVGHSSGGFYAAQTAVLQGDPFEAVVLLSPVMSHRAHIETRWFSGPQASAIVRERAAALVRRGEGIKLIPLSAWYHAISAASLLERFEEQDAPLDRLLKLVQAPTLLLCGELESDVEAWRRAVESAPIGQFGVVPGVDHAFLGAARGILERVRTFLGVSDVTSERRDVANVAFASRWNGLPVVSVWSHSDSASGSGDQV